MTMRVILSQVIKKIDSSDLFSGGAPIIPICRIAVEQSGALLDVDSVRAYIVPFASTIVSDVADIVSTKYRIPLTSNKFVSRGVSVSDSGGTQFVAGDNNKIVNVLFKSNVLAESSITSLSGRVPFVLNASASDPAVYDASAGKPFLMSTVYSVYGEVTLVGGSKILFRTHGDGTEGVSEFQLAEIGGGYSPIDAAPGFNATIQTTVYTFDGDVTGGISSDAGSSSLRTLVDGDDAAIFIPQLDQDDNAVADIVVTDDVWGRIVSSGVQNIQNGYTVDENDASDPGLGLPVAFMDDSGATSATDGVADIFVVRRKVLQAASGNDPNIYEMGKFQLVVESGRRGLIVLGKEYEVTIMISDSSEGIYENIRITFTFYQTPKMFVVSSPLLWSTSSTFISSTQSDEGLIVSANSSTYDDGDLTYVATFGMLHVDFGMELSSSLGEVLSMPDEFVMYHVPGATGVSTDISIVEGGWTGLQAAPVEWTGGTGTLSGSSGSVALVPQVGSASVAGVNNPPGATNGVMIAMRSGLNTTVRLNGDDFKLVFRGISFVNSSHASIADLRLVTNTPGSDESYRHANAVRATLDADHPALRSAKTGGDGSSLDTVVIYHDVSGSGANTNRIHSIASLDESIFGSVYSPTTALLTSLDPVDVMFMSSLFGENGDGISRWGVAPLQSVSMSNQSEHFGVDIYTHVTINVTGGVGAFSVSSQTIGLHYKTPLEIQVVSDTEGSSLIFGEAFRAGGRDGTLITGTHSTSVTQTSLSVKIGVMAPQGKRDWLIVDADNSGSGTANATMITSVFWDTIANPFFVFFRSLGALEKDITESIKLYSPPRFESLNDTVYTRAVNLAATSEKGTGDGTSGGNVFGTSLLGTPRTPVGSAPNWSLSVVSESSTAMGVITFTASSTSGGGSIVGPTWTSSLDILRPAAIELSVASVTFTVGSVTVSADPALFGTEDVGSAWASVSETTTVQELDPTIESDPSQLETIGSGYHIAMRIIEPRRVEGVANITTNYVIHGITSFAGGPMGVKSSTLVPGTGGADDVAYVVLSNNATISISDIDIAIAGGGAGYAAYVGTNQLPSFPVTVVGGLYSRHFLSSISVGEPTDVPGERILTITIVVPGDVDATFSTTVAELFSMDFIVWKGDVTFSPVSPQTPLSKMYLSTPAVLAPDAVSPSTTQHLSQLKRRLAVPRTNLVSQLQEQNRGVYTSRYTFYGGHPLVRSIPAPGVGYLDSSGSDMSGLPAPTNSSVCSLGSAYEIDLYDSAAPTTIISTTSSPGYVIPASGAHGVDGAGRSKTFQEFPGFGTTGALLDSDGVSTSTGAVVGSPSACVIRLGMVNGVFPEGAGVNDPAITTLNLRHKFFDGMMPNFTIEYQIDGISGGDDSLKLFTGDVTYVTHSDPDSARWTAPSFSTPQQCVIHELVPGAYDNPPSEGSPSGMSTKTGSDTGDGVSYPFDAGHIWYPYYGTPLGGALNADQRAAAGSRWVVTNSPAEHSGNPRLQEIYNHSADYSDDSALGLRRIVNYDPAEEFYSAATSDSYALETEAQNTPDAAHAKVGTSVTVGGVVTSASSARTWMMGPAHTKMSVFTLPSSMASGLGRSTIISATTPTLTTGGITNPSMFSLTAPNGSSTEITQMFSNAESNPLDPLSGITSASLGSDVNTTPVQWQQITVTRADDVVTNIAIGASNFPTSGASAGLLKKITFTRGADGNVDEQLRLIVRNGLNNVDEWPNSSPFVHAIIVDEFGAVQVALLRTGNTGDISYAEVAVNESLTCPDCLCLQMQELTIKPGSGTVSEFDYILERAISPNGPPTPAMGNSWTPMRIDVGVPLETTRRALNFLPMRMKFSGLAKSSNFYYRFKIRGHGSGTASENTSNASAAIDTFVPSNTFDVNTFALAFDETSVHSFTPSFGPVSSLYTTVGTPDPTFESRFTITLSDVFKIALTVDGKKVVSLTRALEDMQTQIGFRMGNSLALSTYFGTFVNSHTDAIASPPVSYYKTADELNNAFPLRFIPNTTSDRGTDKDRAFIMNQETTLGVLFTNPRVMRDSVFFGDASVGSAARMFSHAVEEPTTGDRRLIVDTGTTLPSLAQPAPQTSTGAVSLLDFDISAYDTKLS